jgi:hypothetical protein
MVAFLANGLNLNLGFFCFDDAIINLSQKYMRDFITASDN